MLGFSSFLVRLFPRPDLPYPHGVPPLSALALSPLPPGPFFQGAGEVAVPGVSLYLLHLKIPGKNSAPCGLAPPPLVPHTLWGSVEQGSRTWLYTPCQHYGVDIWVKTCFVLTVLPMAGIGT